MQIQTFTLSVLRHPVVGTPLELVASIGLDEDSPVPIPGFLNVGYISPVNQEVAWLGHQGLVIQRSQSVPVEVRYVPAVPGEHVLVAEVHLKDMDWMGCSLPVQVNREVPSAAKMG